MTITLYFTIGFVLSIIGMFASYHISQSVIKYDKNTFKFIVGCIGLTIFLVYPLVILLLIYFYTSVAIEDVFFLKHNNLKGG